MHRKSGDELHMMHLELFSGIGGFRQALAHLEKDFGISQTCIGFSEIDDKATHSYKRAFNISNELEMGDIVNFVSREENIDKLPDFDLLTAGFPCQPFSMMGSQKGFDDQRGTMFFQVMKILQKKHPKYVLLENVRNLITHDKGKTIQRIISCLKECGYETIAYDVFNTADFDLPQKRNRVYIFASTEVIPNLDFNSVSIKNAFYKTAEYSSLVRFESTHDLLEKNVDGKYYLSEKIKPTILADGSANFKSKSEINLMIARPLTATMTKMHRACQDNYYSEDFIQSADPAQYLLNKYSKEELSKQRIRKLTPREAFLLQGFSNTYFEKIYDPNIADCHYYHQAGNAVSVNTVYAITYYLFVKKELR